MSFHPARFATEEAVSRTALPCVIFWAWRECDE